VSINNTKAEVAIRIAVYIQNSNSICIASLFFKAIILCYLFSNAIV